jgi:hypothetical protein
VAFAVLAILYLLRLGSVRALTDVIDRRCDALLCDYRRHFLPMARAITSANVPVPGYFYSAFFALLLTPLGVLTDQGALEAWGIVQLASLIVVVLIPLRSLLVRSRSVAVCYMGLVVAAMPIYHNLAWGQMSLPIIAIVLVAVDAHISGRRILAGCLIGLAAAMKYYPAMFAFYFLVRRDVRAITAFFISGAVLFFVFPATVMGFSDWYAFQTATLASVSEAGWAQNDVNSQYFVHVGLRYAYAFHKSLIGAGYYSALRVVGYIVAVLNLGIVVWLRRRRGRSEAALSLTAILLIQPFVLRTSWPHYFCVLPICQVILFSELILHRMGRALRGALFASVSLSVLGSSMLLFYLFGNWKDYSYYGMLFLANLCLLPPLYVLSLMPDEDARFASPISYVSGSR